MEYTCNIKCSYCGAEAKSTADNFPLTCGMCDGGKMYFVSNIKGTTEKETNSADKI